MVDRRGFAALTLLYTLVLSAVSCHAPVSMIPGNMPSVRGRVVGFQLESAAGGPGGLRLLRLRDERPMSSSPLAGFARIDGTTRFATSAGVLVDWNLIGLRDLVGATVRVWYRGQATSQTDGEIWGDADLVVVDATDSLTRQVAGFVARYATSMRTGDRAALVASYATTGVNVLGDGRSATLSSSDIRARFDSLHWMPPVAYEWKDLSWESVGPDAVVLSGGYLLRAKADDRPRAFSYSALLRRRAGIVQIVMEHVSSAPSDGSQ